ncbi:MAG: peptide chain release factor 1 [Elusimicrobia bacterium]|nr:peptide chain release factor 1 [Elusimicrobiota bacterium]
MFSEAIKQKLEKMYNRTEELERLLSDPSVISNSELYRKYSKEHSLLLAFAQNYREYKNLLNELKNLDELKSSSDTEIKIIAESEYVNLSSRLEKLETEMKIFLIPPDPNEGKNIIVEIRAGTGGEEAALFAGDLFRMYCRYAESKGYKIEQMDSNPTGIGGFKEVIFSVSGKDVWKYFKFERGIHRVQRVPETEASGRIHTSAVTVAVLPEAEEVDVEVKPEDLRIDTYRASGAGGQHVNKTDSAVRITHIPSGVAVACQDERSQMKNRAKAMQILRAKLYDQKMVEQENSIIEDRRKQVGSGDRSEKIRTYNFPQNRITDHRLDFSIHRLKEVLEGDMDELLEKLITADQEQRMSSIGR